MSNDVMQAAMTTWAAKDLPARLLAAQVAKLLNCSTEDVAILVSAGKLRALGKPKPNAVKFFSSIELITLLPFVIPAIVLVFGLIRVYSRPPLLMTDSIFKTDILLVGAYVILTFPYMYRAIDIGLRSIDILTLTEAAQSLGANWYTILFRVIFPNLRVAIISGALITFATVMGEFILAAFLARPALGPYMAELGRTKAFEPAALAMISYALTLVALGLISLISRGSANQQQISGAH